MTAPTALLVSVGIVYVGLTALLIGYGANLAYHSLVVLRRGRPTGDRDTPVPPLPTSPPIVTVQLPVYNEMYVAERVIDAACALDWPADRLEIQVLDDSTDATVDIVARAVRRQRAQGIRIDHIRRPDRTGFKAGALAHGLDRARGEYVAIFDADFVPPPDFLRRAMPRFESPDVAFVQARWGHLNRDYSPLTRLQALAIDGHFLVEQAAREVKGFWFNFNGTAGVWRTAAIHDAGGWTAETLTEDLDLSYRAHLRGWRGRFAADIVVPGEVPAHMSGFRRQQHRWARGSLECALRLVPSIWRTDTRTGVKVQATAHLTSYAIHLLLFGVTILYPLVVLAAADHPELRTFFGIAYPLALFSLAPILFFVTGQHQRGRPWWRDLHRILAIALIGPGLMMNTVRAAWSIVRDPNPEFERTAKFGMGTTDGEPGRWTTLRYQLRFDRIVLAEAALGTYALATAALAASHRNWAIVTYAALFGVGLIAVATMTIVQSVHLHRQRAARAARQREEDRSLGPGYQPATTS